MILTRRRPAKCKICGAKDTGPTMQFPHLKIQVYICGNCIAHFRYIFGQTIKVEQAKPGSSAVAVGGIAYDSNIPYMLPGESMDDTRKRLGEFIPKPKRR